MQKLNCILLITTLLISCNVFNNETIKKIPTDVLFELKKSGCYGTCPIYSISIDANGNIKYEGKRFVEAIGSFTWQMNDKDFKELRALLNKKMTENVTYNLNVQDLPLTQLNINNKYEIKFKGGCPEKFKTELQQIKLLLWQNTELKMP